MTILQKPLGEDGAQKSCCWGTGCAVESGRLGIVTASTWYEEDDEGVGPGEIVRRFWLPSATEFESVGEAISADSGVSRGRAAIGNGAESGRVIGYGVKSEYSCEWCPSASSEMNSIAD